jgi:hypothetical protein
MRVWRLRRREEWMSRRRVGIYLEGVDLGFPGYGAVEVVG